MVPEDSERLLEFISEVSDNIHKGIVPRGESHAQKIWDIRENIDVASA